MADPARGSSRLLPADLDVETRSGAEDRQPQQAASLFQGDNMLDFYDQS